MQKGEFVRASLAVEKGYLRLRVLEPRARNPLVVIWAWEMDYYGIPTLPVAFEAPSSGIYIAELSVPVMSWSSTVGPFRVQIDEWLSAAAQAARRTDLRRDARTAWLREHAIPVRSVDPADEDFSDLAFLREQLRGARMVLLGDGAASHGGGSELNAKVRLVKFLHRELGFDVLAFEAGLFGTSIAWRALQGGVEPQEAFLKGSFRIFGLSAQVQPLIQYLAAAARSDNPLELAGFDSQFSGTAGPELLPTLRKFLAQAGIGSALADSNTTPSRIFAGLLEGRFGRKQMPAAAEQAELVQSLRSTAEQVEKNVSGRDGLFWAQVLRSAALQTELALQPGPWDHWGYARARDRQMAENLLWLTKVYYPDRKIIVWAHTFHVMRNPRYTTLGREQGFTMGHGVWEALGEESFVVGVTAYTGASGCVVCTEGMDGLRQDIIADQHPSFEFEELMDAAGHEIAWVNLRSARARRQWLGGTFAARPVYSATERAPWSELLDALLFIRTQEPSRKVRDVR